MAAVSVLAVTDRTPWQPTSDRAGESKTNGDERVDEMPFRPTVPVSVSAGWDLRGSVLLTTAIAVKEERAMTDESLAVLRDAFDAWRRRKRHAREAVPGDLVERARAAARHHGPAAVSRATKVPRDRLVVARMERGQDVGAASIVPAYSRVEVAPAGRGARPFAEVETPSGLTVRFFTETGGALGLLSALLGAGGAR